MAVDFLPRCVRMARANAVEWGMENAVRFECADIRTWEPPHKFDVIFSFDAFERREFYRPTDPAPKLGDIAGGLNLMKYSEFLLYAERTGWRFRFLKTNTFLRSGPLRVIADLAVRTRVVRDFVVHNVYAVMESTLSVSPNDAEQGTTAVDTLDRMAA